MHSILYWDGYSISDWQCWSWFLLPVLGTCVRRCGVRECEASGRWVVREWPVSRNSPEEIIPTYGQDQTSSGVWRRFRRLRDVQPSISVDTAICQRQWYAHCDSSSILERDFSVSKSENSLSIATSVDNFCYKRKSDHMKSIFSCCSSECDL